ncbi:TetR/AcrR family transcriptional regulator [Mycolicibacterium rhodesiae]|uniref:TetR family transcriptional regulator n=1 Tax=Mycolicibacterium rhodesiae TaxID=36814 RepID=A0A1X0IHU9_MYCRH|nr:TetR/AcrR family transcriptional regulator [Mycolicibacterium rhodesiae]MCV7343504.1 TetR/AcrR family transcriptional regulator [Mycolicibacterium rhodesiae]ORB46942.1 TetR family transcriptional regulator [Mycolicibacterium rhodesiae]
MIDKPCRGLRKDAELNRQRIVQAARELFAVRGLEATLNDIAHYAGVGVGTVYRRFATKEELLDAIFSDGIDQVVCLAETAAQQENSWDGFVWFVEHLCELTATDRGLRQMVYSSAYGGQGVECARLRLTPPISKLVERARDDGYLRRDAESTDMPILGMLAGTVSEWAGHVEPELWRRYVALLLEGMRSRDGQEPLPVDALDDDQMDAAMRGWHPAG